MGEAVRTRPRSRKVAPAMTNPTGESPGPSELWRRMDDIKDQMISGLTAINERLDRMPTSELLTVHLKAWEQQLSNVRDDVRRVEQKTREEIQRVEQEADRGRRVLHEKFENQQREAANAKRWAIGALIAGSGAVIAFVSVIVNIAGGSPV